MSEPLTEQERRLHLLELEKLRQELFKRRTPEQCFIAEEWVVAPLVFGLVDLKTNCPIRNLLRGGFKFELHFPETPRLHWIQVQHWEDDRYWLATSFNQVDQPLSRYTRFSLTVPFERLERKFLRCIGTMLKECSGSDTPLERSGPGSAVAPGS
jgi:hypothetical protein